MVVIASLHPTRVHLRTNPFVTRNLIEAQTDTKSGLDVGLSPEKLNAIFDRLGTENFGKTHRSEKIIIEVVPSNSLPTKMGDPTGDLGKANRWFSFSLGKQAQNLPREFYARSDG